MHVHTYIASWHALVRNGLRGLQEVNEMHRWHAQLLQMHHLKPRSGILSGWMYISSAIQMAPFASAELDGLIFARDGHTSLSQATTEIHSIHAHITAQCPRIALVSVGATAQPQVNFACGNLLKTSRIAIAQVTFLLVYPLTILLQSAGG